MIGDNDRSVLAAQVWGAHTDRELDDITQKAFDATAEIRISIEGSSDSESILFLTRHINFVTLHEPLISVGLSTNREIILFDPDSVYLDQYYRKFLLYLCREGVGVGDNTSVPLLLQMMMRFVHEEQSWRTSLSSTVISSVESLIREESKRAAAYLVLLGKASAGCIVSSARLEEMRSARSSESQADDMMLAPLVFLEKFIQEKAMVCRHFSLLSAYIMSRLVQDRILPDAQIYTQRGDVPGGAHAWAMFNPEGSDSLYVVDLMMGFIANLATVEGAEHLKDKYGEWSVEACFKRAGKLSVFSSVRSEELGVFGDASVSVEVGDTRRKAAAESAIEYLQYRVVLGKARQACQIVSDDFNFVQAPAGFYMFPPGFVGMRTQGVTPSARVILEMKPIDKMVEPDKAYLFFEILDSVLLTERGKLEDKTEEVRARMIFFGTIFNVAAFKAPSVSKSGVIHLEGTDKNLLRSSPDKIKESLAGEAALFAAYLLAGYLRSREMPVKGVSLHKQIEFGQMTYWLEVVTENNVRYFMGSGVVKSDLTGFFQPPHGGPIAVLSEQEYKEKFNVSAFCMALADVSTESAVPAFPKNDTSGFLKKYRDNGALSDEEKRSFVFDLSSQALTHPAYAQLSEQKSLKEGLLNYVNQHQDDVALVKAFVMLSLKAYCNRVNRMPVTNGNYEDFYIFASSRSRSRSVNKMLAWELLTALQQENSTLQAVFSEKSIHQTRDDIRAKLPKAYQGVFERKSVWSAELNQLFAIARGFGKTKQQQHRASPPSA